MAGNVNKKNFCYACKEGHLIRAEKRKLIIKYGQYMYRDRLVCDKCGGESLRTWTKCEKD